MNREQILACIDELSKSKGFYSRLKNALNTGREEMPNEYEKFMRELEEQNFKDAVDLVLYLES